MWRSSRNWIALALIGAGVVGALVWRRDVPLPTPETTDQDSLVRRARETGAGGSTADREAVRMGADEAATTATTRGAEMIENWPLDEIHAPPTLDVDYPSTSPTGAAALSPEEYDRLRRERQAGQHEDERPKTHVVADGDTLHLLAARYLGDSGRYLEIYAANRELLRSAEVLPIGVELRIPDPAQRPPAPSVAEQPRNRSILHPAVVRRPSDEPAAMVDIPPGTLRPLSPASGSGHAPYRVQRGDTLLSIARRIYGDPSRYNEIYTANRDRLDSPDHLPEGILLAIP